MLERGGGICCEKGSHITCPTTRYTRVHRRHANVEDFKKRRGSLLCRHASDPLFYLKSQILQNFFNERQGVELFA